MSQKSKKKQSKAVASGRPALRGAMSISAVQPASQTASSAGRAKRAASLNERWMVLGACLILVASVWAVFGQTLGFQFVNYDDDVYVYDNPHIKGGLSLKAILWAFTHTHSENWHPLTTLSHMLDCQWYGLQPWGHHLGNVMLHCAAAILLFLAIKWMTGALWRSAFVALVFAVHPLRAESVAWVSERKDVLSGIFFMLTLLAYAHHAGKRQPKGLPWLATFLFALGLMSKPTLVPLPFLLLLLDYWPLNRLQLGADWRGLLREAKPLVLEKIPLFFLSACSCAVTLCAQKQIIERAASISFPWRVANAAVAYFVYLVHMFWPVNLAVLYPHPGASLSWWEAGLALLVLAAISAASCALRKSHPWLAVGWLWFLGMMIPVIGIVQVGYQALADRYTYLPQIGLYVAIAWAVAELGAKLNWPRSVLMALSAFAIAALALVARLQTAYWHDSELLWNHTLACTERNYIAHCNLGNVLFNGRLNEAIGHYQKAIEIQPDYVQAHSNLGFAFAQKGQWEEAIAHSKQALAINPSWAEACYNIGLVLSQQRQFGEAIAYFQKALEIRPDYAQSENHLALALSRAGRFSEAISHYQKALEINPEYVQIQNDFAYFLVTCREAQFRNGVKAEELAKGAEQRAGGNNPKYLGPLAAAYAEQGRFPEAIETAKRAIELADAQGNSSMSGILKQHLKLYQAALPLSASR